MLPDRVSNPGPLTYESGALSIVLHGLVNSFMYSSYMIGKVSVLTVHNHISDWF